MRSMGASLAVILCTAAITAHPPEVDAAGPWTALGPDTAEVTTVVIDPGTPWNIFAGTAGGGVFVSRDGGRTWRRSNAGLTDLDIYEITLSPHDPDTLLVSVKNQQILVTRDGGDTWSRSVAGLPYDQSIQSFAFDPARPEVVWAGGWHGVVYRSEDGGQSWAVAGEPVLPSRINVLAVEPGDGRRIWAAGQGVSLSSDGGKNWEPVPGGLISPTVAALELVQTAAGIRVVIGTYGGGVLTLDQTPPRRPSGRMVSVPGAATTRRPQLDPGP
jgi:photosystem II stability/assembly factor-like uncharacterized protein